MSKTGIQRTIAVIIFLSPWIYVPLIFKELVFILCAIFLYISTMDLKKKTKANEYHEEVESRVAIA